MKTIKRQLIMRSIVAMTALFLFLLAGSSHTLSFAHTKDESVYISGQWVEDEVGWRFVNHWNSSSPAGTWAEYQGYSYYFMDNGYMVTGWKYLNNHWYFFNKGKGKQEGSMVIGWVYDPDYNGWFYTNEYGILSTGWHRISGSWYYFNQNQDGVLGLMATNRMVEGSYVDANGRMNEVR
ncbi:glucan-binding protein [Lacrimispora sp.]|uniref:glucan-binding protein n=1 Tax=Lacrimispora sp. TaxID=2719234 RepID=UPI0028AB0ACE|nr:glucan-binding protein [Lacrimispora sp.]